MMLLALDPGPHFSAWLLYDSDSARIVSFGKNENESLLKDVFFEKEFDLAVDLLAIEMVASYGMPVGAEVFQTCVWIGRFIQFFAARNVKSSYIFRKDVKINLCGSMRAKDGNVRQALLDRFGPPGSKKDPGNTYGIYGDVWSALAVAVTYCDLNMFENKEVK